MKFIGWHLRAPNQKAHCWVRMDDGDIVTLCGRRGTGLHQKDEIADRCSRCVRAYNDISIYLVARRVGYEDVLDEEDRRAKDVLRTEVTA